MPRMINKNFRYSLQNSDGDSEGNDKDQVIRKRLKKGPWTATEDAILMEYVKKYGEGNWNSVQKNSGLVRCGKSCRLRWANHLRPNLKKGSFTPEEERIIVQLHARIGNKWARMAAQLPGRTDNEIKNYWNTRIKRRERAGLPIYPHDIQQEEAIAYPVQQEQRIPSSAEFFSASQPNKLNCNTSTHVVDPLSFSSFAYNLENQTNYDVNGAQQNNQFKVFSESMNHCGLATSVSPVHVSPYDEPSSSTVFNQGFTCQSVPTQPHDYNTRNNPFSSSFTAMLMGVEPYVTYEMLSAKEKEVPSIQTPSLYLTPASSYTNSDKVFEAGLTDHGSKYKLASMSSSQKNNGLLEDLVLQGQSISCSSSSRSYHHNLSDNGKSIMADHEFVEEEDAVFPKHNETHPSDTQRDENAGFPPSSTETKHIMGDHLEEMNPMDDDLLCLLTNFPSCMPLPEWYRIGEAHTSSTTTNHKVQHDSANLF